MRKDRVEMIRKSTYSLREDKIQAQLDKLKAKAIGNTLRGMGWGGKYRWEKVTDEKGHTYRATLTFYKDQKREKANSEAVFQKQFGDIVRRVMSMGKGMGWVPSHNGDGEQQSDTAREIVQVEESKATARTEIALPEEIKEHFGHIFARDAQIRVVYQAIQAAIKSGFQTRNHCVLWGKPACGKTEILLAFERMLGPDAVVKLDATMTTKAGAENLLLEMDSIPPILILEEAEKVNPVNLSWLLGVLDGRGEIIKTNARVGSIRKDARCLCLATVNNMDEFKTVLSGALASRFQHKVYCPRPNRDILEKILAREIEAMHGNPEWIKPCLDYCLEVEKTNDPRRVISVLDGRDKLLTGEYQADLEEIRKAMEADQVGE